MISAPSPPAARRVDAFHAEQLAGVVGRDQQGQSHHRLDDAGRRQEPELRVLLQVPDDVGVQDIRGFVHHRVVQVEDLVETDRQDVAEEDDRHDRDRVGDARQGDVPRHLVPLGAFHLRALVERRIDAGDRRQVDDRGPAGLLPQIGGDQHPAEVVVVDQEADLLEAERLEQHVDGAGVPGEQGVDDAGQRDPGDEVRQVGNRLHHPLEAGVEYLVEQ